MAANLKTYTFDEVEKHNKLEDCWLIVHGKVYDVSPFIVEHPGGEEVMLSSTGKDATSDYEDIGHSEYAKDLMKNYVIGQVDMSTVPVKRQYLPPLSAHESSKNSSFAAKILQILVPLFILAFAYAQYTKQK
ncbi:cytochrome b5-like isoform X1 [Primulina huaijiensis]|uniref:cytochrome b5-like isoform X1 n=1 Tax=Primulina huaijiensis TaxID=1492673 RepID=UPI003CC71B6D